MKNIFLIISLFVLPLLAFSQSSIRERTLFDHDWKFAYGHPFDSDHDFHSGTSYFSYLAKAGYGDGAASAQFDDRAWCQIDLPHDWAVEVPFSANGSHSHGYKAIGRNFPETSVGWYRKTFQIPETDKGKQIFLDFDGVSRDAQVWVNGFYMGNEPSGYQSFSFNITEVLNYGGENVVAVRADVTIEEGWFYEGAGIYRHVWLRKTNPVYVPKDGIFVYSKIDKDRAEIFIEAEVTNKTNQDVDPELIHEIIDADGNIVGKTESVDLQVPFMLTAHAKTSLQLESPRLWNLSDPYLYKLRTKVLIDGTITDEHVTRFGVRSIRFDADRGFFLNGKSVKLKGTNNHQDHAGVGVALSDDLIRWRLEQLKSFGSNAYRSAHNPPTPALLDLCDEMGILVINENRLMGTHEYALNEIKRLIRRDRNHPSVITWSIGNEEWAIEGNEKGARIAKTMQDFVHQVDPTRPVNAAISGGWGGGISNVIEIMGYNYLAHGSTDAHHKRNPNQPSIGTEEGSTFATRGIYFTNDSLQYQAAYDRKPRANWYNIQESWQHYAARDYLSGMFIWTGFDYRGEPTPYRWPSVTSYFGMMDLCGFPKDNVYYLKSWWQDDPVLHILPHWNWEGKEKEEIEVWAYSNCEQVELFLNGKSLGKKNMPDLGHLVWKVPYQRGELRAIGINNDKEVLVKSVETAGNPSGVNLKADKKQLSAGEKSTLLVTVEALDSDKRPVPTAQNEIEFEITGPAKIIGVGNGDPTSLEKEVFIDSHVVIGLNEVRKEKASADNLKNLINLDNETVRNSIHEIDQSGGMAFIGQFSLNTAIERDTQVKWFYEKVAQPELVYLNGQLLEVELKEGETKAVWEISSKVLKQGINQFVIVGEPLRKKNEWDIPNAYPGSFQIVTPSETWKRNLFNGLAQLIIETSGEKGQIEIVGKSEGLKDKVLLINVE